MLKLWNGAIWFQYLKLEIHFVFRKPFWLRKLSYLLSTERWHILDTFLCGVLVNWTLVYAADAPLQRVEATQVRLANHSSLSSCQWTNQRSSLPGQQSSGVSGSSYQDHKWHCILSSQPPPSSLDRGTYAEGFITMPLFIQSLSTYCTLHSASASNHCHNAWHPPCASTIGQWHWCI